MYRKLLEHTDKKNFGARTTIYHGDDNYFIILSDRDGETYWFLDLDMERLYPVNTYLKSIGFSCDRNRLGKAFNDMFDVDLSKLGSSDCPKWLRDLIKEARIKRE